MSQISVWIYAMQTLALLACSTLTSVACGNEEWYLVFKAVTGGTISAYDLYKGCDTSYVTKENAFNGIPKNHFKSDVINYWETMNIKEVKIEIHKDGASNAFFIFNATGTNKTNWFSKDKLLNTSYTDLNTTTNTIFFGIEGDTQWTRHFIIHAHYNGCGGDDGWIMVTEKEKDCPYEKGQLGKSVVIFSPRMNATKFSGQGNKIVADSMNIYVKFDSNKAFCILQKTVPTTSVENPSTTTTSDGISKNHKDTSTTGFKQVDDVKDKVEKLKKTLTVNKKSTNKHKRTLISPYDNRTSAVAMGTVGVAIICIVVGLIVAADVMTCFKSLQTKTKANQRKNNNKNHD